MGCNGRPDRRERGHLKDSARPLPSGTVLGRCHADALIEGGCRDMEPFGTSPFWLKRNIEPLLRPAIGRRTGRRAGA